LVSIHNNASPSASRRGTEVYRSIKGGGSAVLGSAVADRLRRSPGLPTSVHARRGDHGDYYYQLRNAKVPAIIVEGAYLTNASDRRLLSSPEFRQKLANSIADGILDYQRTLTARPLPATATPSRVTAPAVGAPGGASAVALNARTVTLAWDASPTAATYNVYRYGTLLGNVSNLSGSGRLTFTDVWAAPGQSYTYEIASALSLNVVSVESAPARISVRTPPIVVALDAGHGGSDPGAIATYSGD
jgi:N-acetylmuramoyl-L-alanine amidase